MTSRPFALALKENYRLIWFILLFLACLPGISLYMHFYNQTLGINPLQKLQQLTGFWTLVLLTITLTITPLRRMLTRFSAMMHFRYGKRLSDWNWIIRTRRMFGLMSFAYATSHVFVYVHFDLGYDWAWFAEDMKQKSFLIMGLIGAIIITPLAITSPKFMMKLMGKYWRKLHRLTYLLAIIALVHYWMAVKAGIYTPWYFTAIITFLLLYRMLCTTGTFVDRPRDDGMEVAPRKTTHASPQIPV